MFSQIVLRLRTDSLCEREPTSFQHVVRRADSNHYRPKRGYGILLANPPQTLSAELPAGTDQSQGRGQILSNINACIAVQSTIKSTLGPYGGDLLLVDENGRQTITNDGATVMKVRIAPPPRERRSCRTRSPDPSVQIQLLDIVHPAARILTDIARSQDAEVGDGTTSVVVLAGEILKEIRDFVDQGVSSQVIMRGLRRASDLAVDKVMQIAVTTSEGTQSETLRKLAATAMSSKLIHRNADFFTKSMSSNTPASSTNKGMLMLC